MEHIGAATTRRWSLDIVIAHLRHHGQVEGLLQIGSLATNSFTAASDYDLIIVLRSAPQLWYVGVTYVDDRFTDLIFVALSALEAIQALTIPVAFDHELAPIIRWFTSGVILFDRSGRLHQLQQKVQHAEWILPIQDSAAYSAWFAINYNLAVAQRLVQASDPHYQMTVSIRMAVYGHTDLWFGYFTIRKIATEGDKGAIRYLLTHDTPFLEAYQQFISTSSIEQKLEHYQRAARMVTAPLGGLWSRDITVMNIAQAWSTWQMLLGEHT
jgi:hypothetical protein